MSSAMASIVVQINLDDEYCINNSIDSAIDLVARRIKDGYMHLISTNCQGIGGPYVGSSDKLSYIMNLVDNESALAVSVFDFNKQKPRSMERTDGF